MDIVKADRWINLTANIGLLGGLILVAVQINQNTEITKAQIANDYYLADMQLELAMMGDEPIQSWLTAVYSPGDLEQEDVAIIDRYFNFGLIQLNRLRKMHRLGLADEELLNDRVKYLRWHLGNEAGRRWWAYERNGYPNDFVRLIDDALADSDFEDNRQLLESILPPREAGLN